MKRILYFFYQWLIFVPLFILISFICAVVTIIGCSFGKGDFWGYYPAHIWSKMVCGLACLSIEVTGRENISKETSYIFVPNHQGYFDIFLIYGYLNHNFKWMMKKSLRQLPFAGKACESAGHIYVDDSGATGIRASIMQAREVLKGGMSLVIFPEGSRTLDGKLHRFKKGAFQLAHDINLPVVPLTLTGPYAVMPRGSFRMTPHRMTLTIHPPIYPQTDDEKDVEIRRKMAYKVIADSLGE